MRFIDDHPTRMSRAEGLEDVTDRDRELQRVAADRDIRLTAERRGRLERDLQVQVEDALSARRAYDNIQIENLRQYEGRPRASTRTGALEGLPMVELNISAIAADTIYAQMIDLMLSPERPVRLRAVSETGKDQDAIEWLQTFNDYVVRAESGLGKASQHALGDFVLHGTMWFYTPWVEKVRITDLARITHAHPQTFSVPLEDTLTPGGVESLDHLCPWAGVRYWLSSTEMAVRSKRGWLVDGAQTHAMTSPTRRQRDAVSHTRGQHAHMTQRYDVWRLYGHFDLDGDGIERDLLIYYNHSGNRVLDAVWQPYDHLPLDVAQYQLRPHTLTGLGPMEMGSTFQETASITVNEFLANVALANTRMWAGPPGAVPGNTVHMRPGRYLNVPGGADQLKELKLSDVYPSSINALSMLQSLIERRTGANEATSPRPSSLLGNRTPGITALSLMQQANKRFTPAFLGAREAIANAARQSLFRYHERLRMQDPRAELTIGRVLDDPEKAAEVIRLLSSDDFGDRVATEMEATSASSNAVQEKQEAMQVAGMIGGYYDRVIQLVQLANQQGLSEAERSTLLKVATRTDEFMERVLRQFPQIIKDPERFTLELEEEIDKIPDAPTAGLLNALQGAGIPGGPGGTGGPGGLGVPSQEAA